MKVRSWHFRGSLVCTYMNVHESYVCTHVAEIPDPARDHLMHLLWAPLTWCFCCQTFTFLHKLIVFISWACKEALQYNPSHKYNLGAWHHLISCTEMCWGSVKWQKESDGVTLRHVNKMRRCRCSAQVSTAHQELRVSGEASNVWRSDSHHRRPQQWALLFKFTIISSFCNFVIVTVVSISFDGRDEPGTLLIFSDQKNFQWKQKFPKISTWALTCLLGNWFFVGCLKLHVTKYTSLRSA